MFRLITRRPGGPHFAHGCLDIAAHQRARQHERARPGQPRNRAHGIGQRLFAHQRNRIHGDVLAPDVMPVRLDDRADRHLATCAPPPMMMIRFP